MPPPPTRPAPSLLHGNEQQQRISNEALLQALCSWWEAVGVAMAPDAAPYAPKYQVVCKETIQKLLFAWLQNGDNRECHPSASGLSYQEFASRLGEPTLWSKWWAIKIEPQSGQPWGRGQWCRLYRLHHALPPYVRFKTLSPAEPVDPSETTCVPWLQEQAEILSCLNDWWDEAGLIISSEIPSGEMEDSILDVSVDASYYDQSMTEISMCVEDASELDATQNCNDYKGDQLMNHRDLIQGLYEWFQCRPDVQSKYPMAAATDKYTFRIHLNQVWALWWASKVEPRCGVEWGRCGRFNRRLRLPGYIRLKESTKSAEESSELMQRLGPSDSPSSTTDGTRSTARRAVLEALVEWWAEAGLVLRPDDMTESTRRDLQSEFNVSKHKMHCLLFTWLKTPSAQKSHPVAASIKFRALSSMLGYLWGRWWDICIAPVVGVRWGGSGHFSNKGVLPFFIRLRKSFAGFEQKESQMTIGGDGEYQSEIFDGSELDMSFSASNLDLSGMDLIAQTPRQSPNMPRSHSTPTATVSCLSKPNKAHSAFADCIQSGLLEALEGDDSCIDTHAGFLLPSTPPRMESHQDNTRLWENVDWSQRTELKRAHSLFTSDPIHSIPVDGGRSLKPPNSFVGDMKLAVADVPQIRPSLPENTGNAGNGRHTNVSARPFVPASESQKAARSNRHEMVAAIQHQAEILTNFINNHRALDPQNSTELAQLAMAQQLLLGVTGRASSNPASPINPASANNDSNTRPCIASSLPTELL